MRTYAIIAIAGLFACVVLAQAKEAASCRDLLRDALHRHHAIPDSGRAVRRLVRITTVRKIGDRLDTTVNAVETVEWNGGSVVRSEGTEVWSDNETLVMIEAGMKRIRFVDLSDKQKIVNAQEQFGVAFSDSLTTYGRSFRCEEISTKNGTRMRLSFVVDSSMQRFFNAGSMTVEVDQRGEIVRMAINHPVSSPIRTTDYIVDEVDRIWTEPGIPGSVRARFVDESGKLRSEFAGYRLSR